ncbi:MAG TPA: aminopeptidase P family protein [Streptosporangiaceae bacterium]|jgi:Xaa-Pro aminopeptidase|nr:aminopeptidase P family protein [Streptosporangiaceae bacterium]
MPEIQQGRRDRLRAELAALGADAALITSGVNVRYLTGLASSNAALLVPAAGSVVLATDSRYALTAEREAPDVDLVVTRKVEGDLAALAGQRGLGRLAFEAHEMTVERRDALAATDGIELRPLGRVVENLRIVKDPAELALLGRACALTGQAFDEVAPKITAGMTERQLAVLIEQAMIEAGAEKPAFDTIVASGPNGAIPHHEPGGRAFAPGDLITIDCGARYGGYHADMTRTVALGSAAGWQREVYGLVAAAQQAGIAAAEPGAAVADVDAAARDVIERAGYGEFFTHGLGHGVGLEIHEAPALGHRRPGRLADRVPITVEPGIYLPGRGGVRIEDTLVVRSGMPSAARDLLTTTTTATGRELLVL